MTDETREESDEEEEMTWEEYWEIIRAFGEGARLPKDENGMTMLPPERARDGDLKEKGCNLNESRTVPNEPEERTPDDRSNVEEAPYLSDEDNAILDRIWDKMGEESNEKDRHGNE